MLQSEITTPINITPSKKARPAKMGQYKNFGKGFKLP